MFLFGFFMSLNFSVTYVKKVHLPWLCLFYVKPPAWSMFLVSKKYMLYRPNFCITELYFSTGYFLSYAYNYQLLLKCYSST